MALRLQLCLIVSLSFISAHPLSRQSNGLRDCRQTTTIPALEVLPGGGWDNLRNLDMGRVMNFSYSQCQTTEDGVYLIPDEVFVIPQKVSGVETNSDMISSWLDQHSTTSHSINADASFFSVLNAKYSSENQRMKTHQVRETAVTARVQVRNHIYTVKTYPDFTLDSRFAHQAEEIADAIENNQTRQAAYLSERLVLDYGTHVITTLEAGATLVQEDYLRASYVADSDSSKSTVTASAGFNFFNKVSFNIGSKDSYETSETRSYEGNVTYSLTQSHGGTLFYPGITLQKWQESTLNNLVAIDRAGMPLHYFLSKAAFPDLPEPTVRKLAISVHKAIDRYYNINMRPGCVQQDSQNFNFQANVDDGSCEGAATNLSFGGVYQQCTQLTQDAGPICDAQAQKNPDTGDYTCREPFTPTFLQSQEVEEGYNRYECHRHCHSCWLFFTCCKKVCGDAYYVRRAKVDTYWCSANTVTQQYSGYLFGGLYGPSLLNPLTKSKSCPPNFLSLKLLANGLMVCLSNDYEASTRFAVPFGGFFSCKSGNPLMKGHSRCPPKFSQHLAAISDGCQVLYCVQSGIFTGGQLLPIHLPPFTLTPVTYMVATNTVAVMTEGDKAWIRVGDTKMWKLADADEIQKVSNEMNNSAMSGGEKFGVVVGVLALVALLVVGVVVVRRKRRITMPLIGSGYEVIRGEGQREAEAETPAEPQCEGENDNPTQALLP
ncbi:macrophage-expressed gene 1 protein-like [Alosa sapidissima]|uniref:macrophage-expressed gene 1 protein-like n=1 Tax=Alosa sapidissima TaxID=34773 RepID=UPI001C0A626E|nr:macrophage-expressed gene 1 protein-like [Alosa sapidissima]